MSTPEEIRSPDAEALILAASTLMESLDVLKAVGLIAEGNVEAVVEGVELEPGQRLELIVQVVQDYFTEAESARQLLILLTQ